MHSQTNSSNQHCCILIIAGGSGSRLWPISRQQKPKQFQALVDSSTLLQHMTALATRVVPIERVMVMATPEFASTIQEQLPDLPAENLLFEPARRDNGPAIALGMIQLQQRDPEANVAILWADQFIVTADLFKPVLDTCFQAAEAYPQALVTVGTNPTEPDTRYGYIQMGKELAQFNDLPVFTVKRFVEKPDYETAVSFVNSWDYLWNPGYKIMHARNFLELFRQVQPELRPILDCLAEACTANDREEITQVYQELPKQSIEYLFTPFIKELLVVPADITWSDVGSWDALHNMLKPGKEGGLVCKGPVTAFKSQNSLIFAKERPIIAFGLENIVVVDDGDTILVMHRDQAAQMKDLTNHLSNTNPELL